MTQKPRLSRLVGAALTLVTLVASAFPGQAASAPAATLTFKPSADAYVLASYPSTNYGASLYLRAGATPTARSYLRFSISGLNGAPVKSARLRLYAKSSSSAGYTARALSSNTWAEKTINYGNVPSSGSAIKTSAAVTSGQWVTVDLTSYIKGEGSYNLVITSSSATATLFSSREAGSGSAPQVVITTGTAAATPTQKPSATATTTSTPSATLPPAATATAILPPAATSTATVLPAVTATATLPPANTTTATATIPPNPTIPPTATASKPAPTITPASGDPQPAFPIRATFYYPWFPEAWDQKGINPYTNYTPSLGYYSSADPATLKKHIEMMQYARIQAGIASWWGQGTQTDTKIAGLLSAAAGTSFRWSLYYEAESTGDPTPAQIQADLTYIRNHYGNNPGFLRVGGKFVVFVYAAGNDLCGMADRWKQGNTVGAFVVLKVFDGYLSCASQPNLWHQYSPAVAADSQGKYSYAISPGFWQKGLTVRLARDPARWTQNVKDMAASKANWQLVTTFSEWGEGTIVEPAAEWASPSGYGQYLDALHNTVTAP